MTIELLADIQELDIELTLLQGNEENQFIIDEYQIIADKLLTSSPLLQNLKSWPDLFNSVRDETFNELHKQAEEDIQSRLLSLTTVSDELKQSWEENEHHIGQQDVINDFLQLLASLHSQSEMFFQVLWNEWIDIKRDDFDVEEIILENQKDNPEYSYLYDEYIKEKDSFDNLANSFPSDTHTITKLTASSKRLTEITSKMDKSGYPEEVRKFFKEITSKYGKKEAPLSTMTEKVFSWLKEQGKLDSYVVKRR